MSVSLWRSKGKTTLEQPASHGYRDSLRPGSLSPCPRSGLYNAAHDEVVGIHRDSCGHGAEVAMIRRCHDDVLVFSCVGGCGGGRIWRCHGGMLPYLPGSMFPDSASSCSAIVRVPRFPRNHVRPFPTTTSRATLYSPLRGHGEGRRVGVETISNSNS